ncbi:MAG: DUF4249 domain-containing protein [Bacteroidia bacterium]|nr:DUF4249 domain-containing protein [Bacteroidia bacterium]
MKLFRTIAFLWVFVGLLTSCERDAEVDPPKFERKPVIMCLMTPQMPYAEVQITYTKPYYGKRKWDDTAETVKGCAVVMTDLSGKISDTFYSTGSGLYRLDFNRIVLVPKLTYELSVTMPDGKVFKAQSTVPPRADFTKARISYFEMREPEDQGGMGWDYTTIPYTLEFEYKGLDERFYVSPQLEASFLDSAKNYFPVELYFQEIMKQGNNTDFMPKMLTRSSFYAGWGNEPPFTLQQFEGAIYTMDKAYRNYYLSQFQYDATPFNEPTLFMSNFSEGSLGVFGCYDFAEGTLKY